MWIWQDLAARASRAAHGSSLVGTVTALVVTTLLIHLLVVYQRRQKLPPGPWPWPVVGNLFVLNGRPHRKLQKLAATYGGLMYIQLGMRSYWFSGSFRLARDSIQVFLLCVLASFDWLFRDQNWL